LASAMRTMTVAGLWLGAMLSCVEASAPPPSAPEPQPPPPSEPPFTAPSCSRQLPGDPPVLVPYYNGQDGGTWGLANLEGDLLVPDIYDELEQHRDGRVVVRSGQRWGVLDGEGKPILPLEFAEIGGLTTTHIVARHEGQGWQLLDLCNQPALPGTYDFISPGPGEVNTIVERNEKWALLDVHGEPLVEGLEPLRWGLGVLVRGRWHEEWALHEDGRVWAPMFGLTTLRIWTDALLTMDGTDNTGTRACIFDAEGEPLLDCDAYLELWPVSDSPPLLFARNDAGWGMIELVEGEPPRVRIPHRYTYYMGDGLQGDDDADRIHVDEHGNIVDPPLTVPLESGPLPEDCGALVSWQRLGGRHPNGPAAEYLDAEGRVVERVETSEEFRGPWQPVSRGRTDGVRNVCTGSVVIPYRYRRLEMCDETHVLASLEDGGHDIYALDQRKRLVKHLDVPLARCFHGQIMVGFGGSKGLVDLGGHELLPIRFHDIYPRFDIPELLTLSYFGTRVYARNDGTRFFDEPLPTPGEFPETVERVLSRKELREHDRATLQRMLDEMHDRYARITPDVADNSDHFGPIETANLATLERLLD
jgi:hypothetical protein